MIIIGDWPICDICNKPVEHITRWNDKINHKVHYLVECHGAKIEYEIDEADLFNTTVLVVDRAFTNLLE